MSIASPDAIRVQLTGFVFPHLVAPVPGMADVVEMETSDVVSIASRVCLAMIATPKVRRAKRRCEPAPRMEFRRDGATRSNPLLRSIMPPCILESRMPILDLRLTANEDVATAMINLIGSIEGIESVEEIADLMPHMDDPDSSSAGLADDIGPGTHLLRIVAGNDLGIRRAHEVAEAAARDHGAVLEVVDDR